MDEITQLARQKIPFAFVLSYDKKDLIIERLDALKQIAFEKSSQTEFILTPYARDPISFESYKSAYDRVIAQIKSGNTYLLNLTFSTPIKSKHSLFEIYKRAKAKYKVYLKDCFVSYSPETFVTIENGWIYTYPMKGTISKEVNGAKHKLLSDPKELAEHTMVVDLLRNDLGIVGNSVKVEKFRYVEDIGGLLQMSSKIGAQVKNWQDRLGEIIDAITPAGSITGTPKKSTCQIIDSIETHKRGFFTGIFGVYDGTSFDSCVLIRYVQQQDGGLIYKSGGGITLDSDVKKEYNELQKKIYLSQ